MKKKFVFKKYSSEYKNQVIDLLKILWHFDRENRLAYFKWKFEDNPYTKAPLAFIALDGEKVVAFRGYMVQPFVFNDSRFLDASLANTVTHEDYRRMGLFKLLTSFSVSEIAKMENIYISLNSSSGGPTLKGYLDLGWIPLVRRDNLFKTSILGILKYLFKIVESPLCVEKITRDEKIEITNTLRVADIVNMSCERGKITHERSIVYYSWRLRNPMSEYTYCYKYDKGGVLKSYIILKKIGYRKYDLIDYNYTIETELNRLLSVFNRKINPLYILNWTVNTNSVLYRKKFRYGFFSLSFVLGKFKKFNKPPFLVKSFDNIDPDLESFVRDVHEWNLFKIIGDEI